MRRKTVERLYGEFGELTFGFFLSKLRDPEAAADLNQELYLRLLNSLKVFRGECGWKTWVFSLARICVSDWRRRHYGGNASREVELDEERVSELAGEGAGADRRAEQILLRQRLLVCLRRLDEAARAVIVGHYFRGVTLRELTQSLALSNASGSRAVLIAAQRKLRKCISSGRAS